MANINWRQWSWQYVLPALILGFGLPMAWWFAGADDSDVILAWVVVPPLAFLIGFFVRPAHVWIVPAILIGLVVAIGVVMDPTRIPAIVGGFFFLAFAPFALSIWAGKALRNWMGETIPRLMHRPPHAPST